MANILYGINGEGSGHWTRSKEVITHLKVLGHNVSIVCSGRASVNLRNFFEIEDISGFSFRFVQGRVDKSKTFWENTKALPGFSRSFNRVSGLIRDRHIDCVITDFEPISCFAAKLQRLPIISIDNQHFITGTDVSYPSRFMAQAEITKAAIGLMTPGAGIYLAISFFEARPKDDKTFVMPPILRRKVFKITPSRGDYVLVYLTAGLGKIAELLKLIQYNFIVYGADKEYQDGNVTFKKFGEDEFLSDLAGSRGVLATAGFSLISEALYLGKPYLAWPVSNQFEQTFNAYHLERLGYGKYAENLDRETIESFLFNLGVYSENLAHYPRQDNSRLFQKLEEFISTY